MEVKVHNYVNSGFVFDFIFYVLFLKKNFFAPDIKKKFGSLLGSALSFELVSTYYVRTADSVIGTVE